jgi:hypothetical protein
MNEEVIIDEQANKVYIFDYNNLMPDGTPLCAEYTIEEYEQLNK